MLTSWKSIKDFYKLYFDCFHILSKNQFTFIYVTVTKSGNIWVYLPNLNMSHFALY